MFNPDKLIFKEAIQATMFDGSYNSGEVYWTLDDLKDTSLSFSVESEDKVDAKGDVIKKFYNAKSVQFTGSTSFFTLSLVAAQMGTEKNIGNAKNKIIIPAREKFVIQSTDSEAPVTSTPLTLKHMPVGGVNGSEIPYIYLFDNKTQIKSYSIATTADETHFSVGKAGGEHGIINLPTDSDIKAGMTVLVYYSYETAEAVDVTGTTDSYPRSGELWIESVFNEVCDKNKEYIGWVVIKSAQLSPNGDIPLNKKGDYSFTIDGTKDYCDENNQFVRFVVPQD